MGKLVNNTRTTSFTAYGAGKRSVMYGKAFDLYDTEKEHKSFETKKRSKFVPKGIDPANPQKNFVKAHYDNKRKDGDDNEEYYNYLYGSPNYNPGYQVRENRRPHVYSGEKKLGKMRLSGNPKAHRIGKR